MQIIDQKTLYEIEARCTQQEPPAAMAACPLHVECREICRAAAKGDFTKAAELYGKLVPLPRTLSALCPAPCRQSCTRRELGGAIDMRAVEEAAMREGKPKEKRIFLPRRSDTAAVIGGGVTGVSGALEMAKKGIHVTLFEKDGRLGGRLFENRFDASLWEADCEALNTYHVEIRFNTEIWEEEAVSVYEAVLLACGGSKTVSADPLTLQTGNTKVFAAGDCTAPEGGRSVLECMADGKRAALSIDRYLKKVNLLYGREKEAPFTTTLHVDLAGRETKRPADGEKDTAWAKEEAARCLQCECLQCVRPCAFMRHFKTYPRAFTRELMTNITMGMGNRTANTAINSCSLCGQCQRICPDEMDLGALIEQARAVMFETGHMPQWPFDFALDDMYNSNHEAFFAGGAPEGGRCDYLFFPGCQLGASSPDLVLKVFADLRKRNERTGILLACCGVGAKWAGREQLFLDTQKMLKDAWESMGKPKLIVACPTCMQTLDWADRVGIWDLLLQELPQDHARGGELTVHDACGARNRPEVQETIRTLLRKMDFTVHEKRYNREKAGCCGYGGYTQYANPEVADQAVVLAAPGDGKFLCYCMNCRDRFSKLGANAVHILELAYNMTDHKPPSYSQRRDNRESLKRRIQKEVYGMEEKAYLLHFPLYYSEDLARQMEERLILEQHIREVIQEAEDSGGKILQRETGLFIAHKRIGNVTFWTYYRSEKDGFYVERAYSHRMEVKV